MRKIEQKVLDRCTLENCLQNEFIILPDSGDLGLEEYIAYKTDLIIRRKHLSSLREQNMLMLEYPLADANNAHVFPLFFESPSVLAKRQVYEGCFAIDVSGYLETPSHKALLSLLSYIRSYKNIVFVLFVYTNNMQLAETLFEMVDKFVQIEKLSIPLPTAGQLAEYVAAALRETIPHIDRTVLDRLEKFFRESSLPAYDTAEQVIDALRADGFTPGLEALENTLQRLNSSSVFSSTHDHFGY